jgi:hypothetical protein
MFDMQNEENIKSLESIDGFAQTDRTLFFLFVHKGSVEF